MLTARLSLRGWGGVFCPDNFDCGSACHQCRVVLRCTARRPPPRAIASLASSPPPALPYPHFPYPSLSELLFLPFLCKWLIPILPVPHQFDCSAFPSYPFRLSSPPSPRRSCSRGKARSPARYCIDGLDHRRDRQRADVSVQWRRRP